MKVNIGPYKSYFGPYQLAEFLCFWVKKEKDEFGIPCKPDWVHKFGEFLAYGSIKKDTEVGDTSFFMKDSRTPTYLSRFLSWLDEKGERKLFVRIDPWDTYSMDDTLGYIISPMLKELRNCENRGAPFVDDEDVPDHLKSTSAPPKENDYDTDDNYFARWDYVLDEMIFAFSTKGGGENADWELSFGSGDHDIGFTKLENGMSEMVKGPEDTYKYDTEGAKVFHARVKNGFRLFGKYYENLWW